MNILGRMKIAVSSALLLLVAACQSSAPPVSQTPVASHTNTPALAPATASGTINMLGSGDKLRITIFGEPSLSGEYVVDGAGMISMPLIGEVETHGLTIREVQRKLEGLYQKGYLNNPKISAEVINFRPYYIMGEIGKPGEYPFTSGLTVLNAIATAEGFTYRANKRVVFIRSANANNEREVRLSSSLMVQPGDTIRIGERLF